MSTNRLDKFNLKHPGHWIAGADRDWAFETYLMLTLVENEFICAVAAYDKFRPVTVENVRQYIDRQLTKYESCLNSIYAKAFVYSLDSITKILKALEEYLDPPDLVKQFISKYKSNFGYLVDIRDSLVHIEDRGRGLDKHKKKVPTNILVLGAFFETRFEVTAANGTRCGVEISESKLTLAHKILQSIINAYEWEDTA